MAVRIKYNGAHFATVADGDTTLLKIAGSKMRGDIEALFSNPGAIIYNGEKTVIEAGKTAIMRCAGTVAKTDLYISANVDFEAPETEDDNEPDTPNIPDGGDGGNGDDSGEGGDGGGDDSGESGGELQTQTLTVINTNNESETTSYIMPNAYTFSEFIDSEYDTSGGKFTGDAYAPTIQEAYVYYDGYRLIGALLPNTASGTFYYAGEATPEPELTKLTIYYVKDGKVGNVRAEYDVPVGMKFEELVDSEYNTNGDFSLITSVDDYQAVLYKGESLNCTTTGCPNPMLDIVYANIIANDGEFYFCCGEEPTQTLRVENYDNAEEFIEYTMPFGTLWNEFVTTQTDSGNTSFTIVDGFVKYNGLTLWSDISGGVSVTANSVASGTVYYRGTHPETQTLTIVNSQYDNEVIATFTMPYGYTFRNFIRSSYDTSGGKLSQLPDAPWAIVFYCGCSLADATINATASGVFTINATPFTVVDLATNESTTYYSEYGDFIGYNTSANNYDGLFDATVSAPPVEALVYYNAYPLVDNLGRAVNEADTIHRGDTYYYESEGVVSGTWHFKSTINRYYRVHKDLKSYGWSTHIPDGFTSNVLGTGKMYYYISILGYDYENLGYNYVKYKVNNDSTETLVNKSTTGWVNDGYRTITFNSETVVDGAFYDWLKRNATKVN